MLVSISKWLTEVGRHPSFKKCPDVRSHNWLVQQVFAHEVCAQLLNQLEEGSHHGMEGVEVAQNKLVYARKVTAVVWVTYFMSHLDHLRIVFIPRLTTREPPSINLRKGSALKALLEESIDLAGNKYF
jgi:hypothetical protein